MRKLSYQNWIVPLSLILIFVYLFSNYSDSSHNIFPDENFASEMFISTYHEKGRQSICNAQIHRENITFSYELKDHEGFPFAGCYFRKRDSSDFITKLAGLNELEITIKSEEGKRIPILLKLNYPPFHDKNDFRELTLEYVLEYEKAGTYNIPLSEFKVPSWWFRAHGIKKESIDLKNYDELMFFVVESCESIATDVKDRIEISKIKFSHNNNHLYLNSAIMLMVLGLGIFGIRIVEKQKAKQATIFVPQSEEKQTKKKSFIEEDTPFFKMKTYINLNYQNPDLDAKKLSKATGVSTREIGSVFKKASGDTFKSYLNHVRMTEVKRLLKSTELSVSEIAYKCGYNQIPHFNRIFKKETGLSPKQYRDIE